MSSNPINSVIEPPWTTRIEECLRVIASLLSEIANEQITNNQSQLVVLQQLATVGEQELDALRKIIVLLAPPPPPPRQPASFTASITNNK